MKTCPSLVKMDSDRANDFMQNKCNKWMKYRNVLPNHKNNNMDHLQFIFYNWLLAIDQLLSII